jgi:hypothetical protein
MSLGKLAYAPFVLTIAAVLAASLLNTAHADPPCSPPCCTHPTTQPVCPTDPPVEHEYDDGNLVVLEAVVNSADAGALSSVGWVSRIDPPLSEQSIIVSTTLIQWPVNNVGGSIMLTHPTTRLIARSALCETRLPA